MKTDSVIQKGALVLIALALGTLTALPARAQFAAQPASALTIPAAKLMQPEELDKLLQKPQTPKPLILQVGSRVMFDEAHITGAEYAGPGSHDEGLADAQESRLFTHAKHFHRDLLRLLPVEPLPQRRPCLQAAQRYGICASEGALPRRQLWQQLGEHGLSGGAYSLKIRP